MVNFFAPPGKAKNPLAGSKLAWRPSGEMVILAAMPPCGTSTRNTSQTRPSGSDTALPSSQPRIFPSSQDGSLGRRLEKVQTEASSRSAPAGADIMNARNWRPHPPGPEASSIARQRRPPWMSTGCGAQWYWPRSNRPVFSPVGIVQVCPPSRERRITASPFSCVVPIR